MSRLLLYLSILCSIYLATLERAHGAAARPPSPAGKLVAQAPSSARRPAGPATTFDGTVLSLRRGAFPDTTLRLNLTRIGNPPALTGRGNPKGLNVHIRGLRRGGEVVLHDEQTVQLAGAYYLLPGDRLKGRLRYDGGRWYLESFERNTAPARSAPVAATPPRPAPARPKVASLRVELSANKSVYAPGEDVRAQLTVTNTGTAPATFTFPTGQRYELAVRQRGREVWRWSNDRAFTQVVSALSLTPGETLTFRDVWPGVNNNNVPVPPGTYTMAGWLTSPGHAGVTESSVEIRIREPQRAGPTVADLIASPRAYLNREITLEGRYRARLAPRGDRLTEGGPPTSRSDWILQDSTGSIYVAGSGALRLDASNLNERLRVRGWVRMNPEGRLYLRTWEVTRAGR